MVIASSRVGRSAVAELTSRFADKVHVRAVLRRQSSATSTDSGAWTEDEQEWPQEVEVRCPTLTMIMHSLVSMAHDSCGISLSSFPYNKGPVN